MTCIYCAGRSGDASTSLEHIWPQSLGGASAPDLFKTRDVCGRCNSTCGLFVDGAFLKSWFISQERGRSAHDYLDPQKPGPGPFWYMGEDTEFPVAEGDVCERWLGLAGEHVYHVHQRDDDRWSPYAGGDVIRRKQDPGRTYIFLTSPTEYWALTALASLIQQFPNASRRCLTKVDGLPKIPVAMPGDPFTGPEEARETGWIDARKAGPHLQRIAIQIDFSDRFLAKLSLGLGHTIIGEAFDATPYASDLRSFLWARTPEAREGLSVRGTGFWGSEAPSSIPEMVKWEGAWSIFLSAVQVGFGMSVTTPGGRTLSMMISDSPSILSEVDPVLLHGAVYIFVPQRQICVGPVPMIDLIAHRMGSRRQKDLASLEQMRSTLASLPSKNTSALPS